MVEGRFAETVVGFGASWEGPDFSRTDKAPSSESALAAEELRPSLSCFMIGAIRFSDTALVLPLRHQPPQRHHQIRRCTPQLFMMMHRQLLQPAFALRRQRQQ